MLTRNMTRQLRIKNYVNTLGIYKNRAEVLRPRVCIRVIRNISREDGLVVLYLVVHVSGGFLCLVDSLKGTAKAIGVSNFAPAQLLDMIA